MHKLNSKLDELDKLYTEFVELDKLHAELDDLQNLNYKLNVRSVRLCFKLQFLSFSSISDE